MAENTKTFPEGWFMIKNLNNGFVLSLEEGSHSTGARVVLTSLNIKDIKETTLWRVDDQQRLVNKQTGQVMDISNGKVKSGTDIVQQIASTKDEHNQSFGLNTDGHIFVKKTPNFVLGIKEPLLFGREGLPCHLQSRSSKKEQKWDFVIPVLKQSSSIRSSVASLKKSDSISTTGSLDDAASISSSVDYQDEQNKSITTGYFPPNEFFIKSVSNGYYIGADASEVTKSGAALSIDKFRKATYKSQLWTYESTTHRIVNKLSGLVLSAGNDLKEDTHVHQMSVGATKHQEWQWTKSGQLCLKDQPDWVLGFKTSVFNISREGAHLYLQKADVKKAQMQTFQVVLPIFKEHSSTTTVTETPRGQFPDGWFFVKSQAHGLVLSVLDSGTLAAEATAVRLDVASYSRQLWKYKNGFLVNKASNYVLDVKGGDIFSGATLCQYKEKKKDNANQQWGLNMDHSIFTKANSKYVLTLQENESVRSKVFLAEKSAKAVKEQTWNFVLPVFKKKKGEQVTKTTTVVKKTVIHRYVHYPRGWFFIRSSLPGATLENAQVLTANADKQTVRISALDREKWHAQLWTFVDGSIVNYETQLAINVNALNVGETVKQSVQQNLSKKQSWALTTEGHFIQLGEPTLGVVPSEDGSSLVLKHIDHLQQQTSRWDLLEPQFKYEHRTQILISWKISLLKEWRNVNSATIHTQKVTPSVASWPEDTFYITTGQGDALVPDKNEAHSSLTSRALKTENHESFRWCFRNGYLVHVATGLVLHARDLANSSGLEIRAQETDKEGHVHQNQSWIIHTDGSIISATNKLLGLGGHKFIELCDVKKARQHISWSVVIGHYEKDVLISFRRYILTIATVKSSSQHELVTRSYGVFPEQWIFIRSKQDANLVITAKTTKEGARLILSKLDFQNFKQQLWHVRDDNCLVNYASNLVIDIAGGQIIRGANIIQYSEKLWRRSRKNQMWGLSVDGHIHPESRNGLVLAPKQALQEGVELTLTSRGALDRHDQQWTFAAPVFRNKSGALINVGLTGNKVITDVIVNGITEATISQTDRHVYRRTVKKTVVRRWGIFPDNEFFVRLNYGTERYALTVEKEAIKENEHQVTLRAMNYKEYKYQLWSYRDGHLVNSQTGLALELEQEGKDVLIESGLQAPAVVREFSMSENQFFALGIHGEIHLQSNSRLLIAVAHEERATFDGAQLGAKRIKVNRIVTDNKEETTLISSKWMQWSFSTPVFKKVTDANGVVTEVLEHECKDHSLHTKENDDTCSENDISDDDDSEDDSDDDLDGSDDDDELLDYDDDKVLTDASDSGISSRSRTSQSKRHSYRLEKKGSFVLPEDYIPTGFEKVGRIKDHQAANFPTSGYFFIKNKLHGYYLEAEEDKAHTNIKVVLSQLKSTDFASQLWSYKDGYLYNLKYGALVLDASAAEVTTAGDLVHLSKASTTIEEANDQQWGWLNEGVIYLKSRRSFILSIKEAASSTKHNCVDVFVLEEKPRLKAKSPRPEQSWTLQVPSLTPTAASASGSKVVVPDTKSSSSSSTLSTALTIAGAAAISTLSYKWFSKLTRITTITTTHWSEKWFMISYGSNNLFLGAGLDKDQAVGLYQLKESDDQKRFLWTFVDGYLVNYRYSLRLVFCQKTQRWLLTDSETEYDQQFSIDTNGVITLRIHKIIYYLRFVYNSSGETLLEITENAHDACQHWQLHAPEFANEQDVTEANEAKTKIHTVVREQQQRRRITTITTTTWTITQRRAYFPDSPWFFIKVSVEGNKDSKDDYVLAQDETTHSLVIKKISFTQFKSQLWTWRDNNLINYGSSLAIGIKDNNLALITSGYKWVLNADGNIHTEESNGDILVFGYEGTELKDNTIVKLYTAKKSESTSYTLIRWGFTTPVFGKRKTDTSASSTTTTTTTTTSQQETHASITASIEQGATIDTLETVQVTKQEEDHYANEINNMTIVTVEHVRIVVRTWWLRLVKNITERAEKEGASEEEIKTIIAKEKETLYAKLDKATAGTTDKRVSEELAIAIKESKTLVEQQTTEAHTCAVQVIKSSDKKAKIEELNKLTKATEDKLNITITEEKVKQTVQKETTVVGSEECHSDVAIVNVETVRITVRTWWLRLVKNITERAEKEGASEEEIKTIIANEKETLYAKLDKATAGTTDKRVSEELAIAIKESKTLVEQQTTEAHTCAVQVIKSSDKKAKVEELNKLTKATEEKLNITITEEKVKQTVQKSTEKEKEHDHTAAIVAGGIAAIGTIGAGIAVKKHHDDKVETEKIQKKTTVVGSEECHSDVAIVNVETVRITVRTWWLRLVQSITERAEKEGASEEEIKTIIAKEKETLYTKLDKATAGTTDKRASEELAIAIKESKTLVEQQTTEAHTCAVQVIKSSDKKAKVEELNKLTKATEEKLNITITEEKVKQTVQKTTEKEKEHDHTGAIVAGGIAAIGAIGAGIAVKKHHDHEKEAEKHKTDKITVVEVKHEVTKPVVKVEEKKSEAVVVVDVEKSKNAATEHVNVVKDNVHGWFAGLSGRVNERIQQGGDEAKTKADVEKITKDARDELHVIIKDSKEKTKTAEGVLVTDEAHAEFEKTITEVHEVVAGKITEVETIVKEHKDTEIKGKLDEIVEKNKEHVNEKLDKSTTVIHQHIEKAKKPEEHHDHTGAIVAGGIAAIGAIGAGIAVKKHHDDKVETEKVQKETTVVKSDECHSDVAIVNVETVRITVRTWWLRLVQSITERAEKEGASEEEIKTIIAKEKETLYTKLDKATAGTTDKRVSEELAIAIKESKTLVEQQTTEAHTCAVQVIKSSDKKAKIEELNKLTKATEDKLNITITEEKVKQTVQKTTEKEKEHDHTGAIVAGGIAAIGAIGAGIALKKHHDHEKEESEKHKAEKTTVVEVKHEVSKPVVKVDEKKSEAVVVVDVEKSKNAATEHVNVVKDNVHGWFAGLSGRVNERIQQGGDEAKTKADVEKITKDARDELHVIIKDSKEKTKAAEGVLVTDEAHAEFEKTITEVHEVVAGKITEVETIVKEHKDTEIKGKLDEIVEKNKEHVNEKLDKSTTVIHQHIEKAKKPEEHHDHTGAIVAGGIAAIGAGIAVKKHHDDKVETEKVQKETIVVKSDECHSDVAIVNVETVRITVRTWWLRLVQSITERAEKEGASEEEIKTIIAKEKETLYTKLDKATAGTTDKRVSEELAIAIKESKTLVEQQTTEAHTCAVQVIKSSDKKAKVEELNKLTKATEEKLNITITEEKVKQTVQKTTEKEKEHDHTAAIAVGAGIAAIGAIGAGIAVKKHHDHEKEEAEKHKTEKTTVVEVKHEVSKPVLKVEEKKSEAVVVVDVEKSKNAATEHVNVVKDNVHGWFAGLSGRVNERIQQGGDEAKTKADVEKITKDARDELHVIIKDSKEKTKAAEGVLVTDEAHAEFEKTITEVHEVVTGKITEVETIVKEHKDTEIKGKLDEIVEKNKEHVNEKLDKSTTVIHQHIEKAKKPEEHHDHTGAIVAGGIAAIGAIGAGIAVKKHHDDKVETEKVQKETTVVKSDECHSDVAIVNVETVRITVRTWWLRLVKNITERAEKEGASEEEIKTIIAKEKETLYTKLDKATAGTTDKRVSEELAIAIKESKTLVEQQTTEAHTCAVQVIKSSDKKAKVEELNKLTKATEEKLNITITEEKVKQTVQKSTEKEKEHDHTGAIVAGGIAAIGAIGAGIAVKKHHDHEKEEAEKHKTEKTTVVEVKHEVSKPVLKVEEKKSEAVVVVDVEKSKNAATEHVNVVKDNVHGWFAGLSGRVNERIQQGGDEAKTKADVEKITKDARDELHVIIKDSKEKTKAAEGVLVTDEAHAEFEKTITEVHEVVAGKITEVETIVKEHKDTEIKGKLDEIVEKNKEHVNEKLDKSTTVIHQHIEKAKKPEEHHDHTGAIVAGGIAAIGAIGAGIAVKKHHDDKVETEKVQKETIVVKSDECHSDVAIVNVETVRITVRTWWLRLVQSITERAEKEGASEEEIKTIIAKEKETLYAKLDKATAGTTDKRVSEELAIAIKESKTLVEQQTTEAHTCAVQVIKSSDKKAKIEELNKLTKATEDKLNITITEEKVKQTVQKTTEKEKEHDHTGAIVAGGIAAIGAIGAGIAVKKHHDHEKEEAEKHKTEKTTIVEVKHEVTKPVVKVDEKKSSEAVVVVDVEKSKNAATEHVNVVKDNVHGWFAGLSGRVNERIQQGGDEAKTKADVEKITKDARDELHVIIKDSKEKTKAAEGVLVTDDAHAEFEKTITEVHEVVAGKITEVETIVKEHKDTEIKGKLDEIVEKNKEHVNEKLDKSTTVIHQHIEKAKKPEEHHDHTGAIVSGGIAAIGAIGAGIAVKKHHDHEKEESEKHKTEKTTVVEVKHEVSKPVLKVEEKKSEAVVVVDVEKSKNAATEHVNVVKDNVHGWFAGLSGRVNERIQQGGDEAKTKADVEKITKDARDELHVIIKDSKEKTKAAEGVLVTDDAHAEFEKTITEVHEVVAGKITEVETIVKEHKDTEIKGKLDEIVEKNKEHVNEKLDKSTTVIHQHIEKAKKPEEHHDHTGAIVAGGIAAIGAIGAGIALKKHHDHEKEEAEKHKTEKTTVVEVKHEVSKPVLKVEEKKSEAVVVVDVEKSKNAATEHVNVVKDNVHGWFAGLSGRVNERIQQGGDEAKTKADVEKITKDARDELHVIIKDSKEKTKAAEGVLVTDDAHAEFEKTITEVHEVVAGKITEVETIVKEHKDTEIKGKLDEIVEKNKEHVNEKLDKSTTVIHQHIEKAKKPEEHHDHTGAIVAGGIAAIGAIGAGIALKKHHDHEKEEAEKHKTEKTTIVEVKHEVTKPVVKVDEKKSSEAVVVVDVEKSKNAATEHVNVVKDNVHGWFAGLSGRVNERIQQGGDEAKTKADVEKITKDARDELHVIIKDSKEKTKTAEGVLVTDDAHAEFEKTITEVHEVVAGKITEVETIVKEHKDTEIKGKLDEIVEKNKEHVNEKLDKSTTVIHQHIEKAKKPEEHHDHTGAIVAGGIAAIGAIGAGIALKKHHDHEKEKTEKTTVVEVKHEVTKPVVKVEEKKSEAVVVVDVEKSKNAATEHVNVVKDNVHGWFAGLSGRVNERIQQGGDEAKTKADVEKITKDARDELHVIIKDSKEKTKAAEGVLVTDDAHAEFEKTITEVHEVVAGKITEVETIVKEHKDTEIKGKLDEIVEKNKEHVNEKLDKSTTVIHQHIEKAKKPEEHHDHTGAIVAGGIAAIGAIGAGIAVKKHHDDKVETEKIQKETTVVGSDECHSDVAIVNVETVRITVRTWWLRLVQSITERAEKEGASEEEIKTIIAKEKETLYTKLDKATAGTTDKRVSEELAIAIKESKTLVEQQTTEAHTCAVQVIKSSDKKAKIEELNKLTKATEDKLNITITEEKVKQTVQKTTEKEKEHDHTGAIVAGGIAAIGAIGAGIAVKKHHDHEKEEAEKHKAEKTTVVEVKHEVSKPVVKVDEKKSEAVVVVDVEKSKNAATEHVNVVKDNVHGWFAGLSGRVNERIQQGGDEAKTKADVEKITKDARDELHVIIKDSKEKTKTAEGVLVTDDAHAEFEKTITEVHEVVAGKITEVETIVKEHKDTEIKGKLDEIVEKNKEHVNEKLDKSTTVIHQHIEKAKKPEEHHDHTGAIVAGGIAAIGAIGAGIAVKKHHDHEKEEAEKHKTEKTTVVEVKHEVSKPVVKVDEKKSEAVVVVDVEKSKNAATEHVNVVKDNVHGWFAGLSGRVNERIQQGGDEAKTKADVEKITKDARDELHVIIKDSKEKTKTAEGVLVTDEAHAEFEKTITEVHEVVAGKITEVETIVKEHKDTEIKGKLDEIVEKNKEHVNEKLDKSTTVIHQHIEKAKKPEEHHDHTGAIVAGGIAAIGAIGAGIALKKHHDHEKEKTEKTTVVEVKHEVTKPVVKVDEKKSEAVVVVDVEKSKNAATEHVNVVKDNVHGWFAGLSGRVNERIQQGGDEAKTKADVEKITKDARDELHVIIKDSKEKTKAAEGVLVTDDAHAEFEKTITEVHEVVAGKITEVETIVKEHKDTEIKGKLDEIVEKNKEHVNEKLDKSTTVIHQHIEKAKKPEEHHDHTGAIVAGGIAAIGAIGAGIAVKKHHDDKVETEKVQKETTVVKSDECHSDVAIVNVETVRITVRTWWLRLVQSITERAEKEGASEEEIKTIIAKEKETLYAKLDKATAGTTDKRVSEELAIAIKESKTLVEQQTTEAHTCAVQVIKSSDKKAKIEELNKLTKATEDKLNITITEEKVKQTVQKSTEKEKEHDHTAAIAVGAGIAAIGAIGAGIAVKKHHDHEKEEAEKHKTEKTTIVEVKHEVTKPVVKVDEKKSSEAVVVVDVEKSKNTATEHVNVVKDNVHGWFAGLSGRVNERIQQGGDEAKTKADVEKITKDARDELHVIIKDSKEKTKTAEGVLVTDEAHAEFEKTITEVHEVVAGKITEVETIVKEHKDTEIKGKLDEIVEKNKEHVNEKLDKSTTVIHQHIEKAKKPEEHHDHTGAIVAGGIAAIGAIGAGIALKKHHDHEKEEAERHKVSVVDSLEIVGVEDVKVSTKVVSIKEQDKDDASKLLVLALSESETRISSWIDQLIVKIQIIITRGNASAQEDILKLIESAQKEYITIVEESKQKITVQMETVSTKQTDDKLTTQITNAQKYALGSYDNISLLIKSQLEALTIAVKETKDLQVLNERTSWILTRAKQHSEKTLKHTTESSISAAFEGKTITWVETAQIPESFGSVKIFVFDVLDSVIDIHGSLLTTWIKLSEKKKGSMAKLNAREVIQKWYTAFLEEKKKQGKFSKDKEIIRITLLHILKEYSVECLFNDEELQYLITAWERLDIFGDASTSIRQLKKEGVYAVAMSSELSTRSMMTLARHGCLCWHSQFSSDVASTTVDAHALLETTADLLDLDNKSELAIVSSNTVTLEAAKKHGMHTVLIDRQDLHTDNHFDATFDGLDVLAESYQVFSDHHSKQLTQSRTWIQRIIDTATEIF